ncbi:hypothetical protein EUGRSUZ_K03221 [Eucalyptus grandis]|uniref:Uncharacterized protein n=1 Tax=Eucalyptus grandis TaxID=71139 RepID=A0ACC3J0G7_EUCGR|nr:hypothetical protein EUGRSUZ_K03221 [Eucalyptus grandis]
MYFSFTLDLEDIDALCCKEACTKNCSCKAAIFQYHSNRTSDNYYLLTQVLLLMNVRKSFLVEVETIDSIHHVNLVRLIRFCTEKFHRLLIYDYISNGSLDRWIFHKSNECWEPPARTMHTLILYWQQMKKIILDIVKGLNYLHEDCGQKIFHLNIESPNIHLDGNFNAKVADFGLFKLIDKDQSHAITTMRETLSYVALEWWSKAITEKIGVYSFGIVKEEHLLDIMDKSSDDVQLNGPTAVNMMSIVAWCLQGDYTKRSSTSMVIKVLKGIIEVPGDLDYDFTTQASTN